MKSETDIRHECSGFTLTTDLIVHHSILNIPNQTTEIICILGIVDEALNIALLSQQLKSLLNIFQFSTNPCLLGVNPNLGRYELTVPAPSSLFLLHCHLQKQVYRVK